MINFLRQASNYSAPVILSRKYQFLQAELGGGVVEEGFEDRFINKDAQYNTWRNFELRRAADQKIKKLSFVEALSESSGRTKKFLAKCGEKELRPYGCCQ